MRVGQKGLFGKAYVRIHPEFSENLIDIEGWRRHMRQREKACMRG